jgi:isopentenyl-diphosphate delta-isomerase type 1
MSEEMLEIINADGDTIGISSRSEIHGNPSLMHRVVHVLVFNDNGELLLQKRSINKDVAPGMWDTSLGGHVAPGEDIIYAAKREMEEELGVLPDKLEPIYTFVYKNDYEIELVFTHRCVHNGPFPFDMEEIDDVKFWSMDKIKKAIGKGLLSNNFEVEFEKYQESLSR